MIVVVAGCGGNNHNDNPDASSADDAPTVDTGPTPDAAPTFGLTAIFPAAASRTVNTNLTIDGFGINGTPTIHLTNCDQATTTYDLTAGTVTATSIATALAADPNRVQGAYTVTVTNGDGMIASLMCALHIVAEPPPTVTLVVPTTAWLGVTTDLINSDTTVGIQGTGFLSTPGVRWVSTTDPSVHYDAVFVGYISPTQITAVVPSETQMMPADTYNVYVTNPDNLTAEWLNGATPGVFTVTATPPPDLTDVSPARITNGSCTSTSMTFTGTGFQTGATLWYVAPSGTTCSGSSTDANGQLLCPITIDTTTATAITAHFAACPALGPYPVVVVNPDGQSDYWYDIEITPSSDGHLNTGTWETTTNGLQTARWKHATQYGFDSFGNAFVYVAGGQDAAGNVLGSVEASHFDVFGTPGPFARVQQYGGPATPRVANDLTVPREGATLVRVGKSLFAIGGTTVRSDSTTPVSASNVVERAEILSYNEMPAIKQPTASGTGLPLGSWYYRISANGPWGESLATREVVAINQSGQIEVCWLAPAATGATSYTLYRSLASDGRANTSAAIAYEVNGANNCFTDTGTEKLAPAPGNARGTVAAGGTNPAGTYAYRVSATVPLTASGTFETYAGYASSTTITAADVTGGMQTVNVAWDAVPIAGVTYRVYRRDPASSTYKLITGADGLTTTSFADAGIAFDASNTTPRTEVRPLATGALSKWTAITPQLNAAREGLDGVVIAMDPATSGGLVARILVAGGRDGTGGTYAYRTTAESLGVHVDGSVDAAWFDETPTFTNARAYYALLTTQDRNNTPFPPPPEPCLDCNMAIQAPVMTGLVHALATMVGLPSGVIANVVSAEPVYVIAVMGDDAFAATNNAGRSDFEACGVDATTGHLTCGTHWVVQTNSAPAGNATFGEDAVLYFSYLYPFAAVARETSGNPGTAIQHLNAAIGRFPLLDLVLATADQVLSTFQSASTSFLVKRAYYQMNRLLAYVYVIGGYAEAHTEGGVAVPAGPTRLVERHQQ
jgi:hypothetical protein